MAMENELSLLLKVEDKLNKSRHNVTVGVLFKMVEELKESIDQLTEAASKEKPLDFKPVIDSIDKVGNAIKNMPETKIPSVDLSPLIRVSDGIKSMASSIESQNRELIKLVKELPSGGDVDLNPLIQKIDKLIVTNSQAIEKSLRATDYSKQLSEIAKAISEKPSEWEFEVLRDQGKIYKINAKAI